MPMRLGSAGNGVTSSQLKSKRQAKAQTMTPLPFFFVIAMEAKSGAGAAPHSWCLTFPPQCGANTPAEAWTGWPDIVDGVELPA